MWLNDNDHLGEFKVFYHYNLMYGKYVMLEAFTITDKETQQAHNVLAMSPK